MMPGSVRVLVADVVAVAVLVLVPHLDVPVMAGIILLKSEKMARYMNKFVPGINVPADIINKMEKSQDKVSAMLEITQELIEKIKPMAHGVHIQALGWEKHVPVLLKNLNI